MIRVAVSGAGGRMGHLVAETVNTTDDLKLVALFDPAGGPEVGGVAVVDDASVVGQADVVVEFTTPEVVMDNLAAWHKAGVHTVVGTSGFDGPRLEQVHQIYGEGPPNVLVVPNFSIGAVVMMALAEQAAPHFAAAEVVELHHDRKVDAPSGTAISTASVIGEAMQQHRHEDSRELVEGARGAVVASVPVHSVRLPGLLAHQVVLFGSEGETLTIRHDTTDRSSFMPGVVLAVRSIGGLESPVTVGLGPLLGV